MDTTLFDAIKLKGSRPLSIPKRKKSFDSECRGKLCFSFDFGEYSTKVTAARVRRGTVEVKKLVIIENSEHGETLNEDNIKEWRNKISRELRKNKLNPTGQIGVCTVSSRCYIGRQISVPYADKKDLQGLVAYELSQILELDMDAYLFQYRLISTYEENGVSMCSVWAVAVPKGQCENYYKLMEALRLKPLRMDVNINGLEYLVEADVDLAAENKKRAAAFIDFGMRGTEISILRDGKRFQVGSIDAGEARLVSAAKIVYGPQIADLHNSSKLTVPPQKIYEIIQQAKKTESAAVFADVIEKWLMEVNNVIRRYNIDSRNTPIEHIYVYGGSQQLSWLKSYIEKYTGISTEILSELGCCRFSAKLSHLNEEIPKFLNAIAVLVRRGENDEFNLFDTLDRKKSASKNLPVRAMVISTVILVLICTGIYGYVAFQRLMLEEQLSYITGFESNEELLKTYTATVAMKQLIASSEKEREFADRMVVAAELANTANKDLRECIEGCIGKDAFLETFEVQGRNVVLNGYVNDIPDLTGIEGRLRMTGDFESVIVKMIQSDEAYSGSAEEDQSTEDEPAGESLPGHLKFSCELVLRGENADEDQ